MDAWDAFGRAMLGDRRQGPSTPVAELPDSSPSVRWSELSARSGRNEKPGLLVGAVGSGLLSDPGELRLALEDTWTTCEWPGRVAEYDLWLTLFDMAVEEGTFLDETELRPGAALPESLQLYRTAAPGLRAGSVVDNEFRAGALVRDAPGMGGGHDAPDLRDGCPTRQRAGQFPHHPRRARVRP